MRVFVKRNIDAKAFSKHGIHPNASVKDETEDIVRPTICVSFLKPSFSSSYYFEI
jgi:hypothetical protein